MITYWIMLASMNILSLLDNKDISFISAHKTTALQVFVFALLEKYHKESFVLNYTNNLTKKQLVSMLNKCDFGCAVVFQNG